MILAPALCPLLASFPIFQSETYALICMLRYPPLHHPHHSVLRNAGERAYHAAADDSGRACAAGSAARLCPPPRPGKRLPPSACCCAWYGVAAVLACAGPLAAAGRAPAALLHQRDLVFLKRSLRNYRRWPGCGMQRTAPRTASGRWGQRGRHACGQLTTACGNAACKQSAQGQLVLRQKCWDMTACCGWVQVPHAVSQGSGAVREHGS